VHRNPPLAIMSRAKEKIRFQMQVSNANLPPLVVRALMAFARPNVFDPTRIISQERTRHASFAFRTEHQLGTTRRAKAGNHRVNAV
jgi:hypothetical protein